MAGPAEREADRDAKRRLPLGDRDLSNALPGRSSILLTNARKGGVRGGMSGPMPGVR